MNYYTIKNKILNNFANFNFIIIIIKDYSEFHVIVSLILKISSFETLHELLPSLVLLLSEFKWNVLVSNHMFKLESAQE